MGKDLCILPFTFSEEVLEDSLTKFDTIYILGGPVKYNDFSRLFMIYQYSKSTNGRVVYIPGLYDAWLCDYALYYDLDARVHLELNSILDIDDKRKFDENFFELFSWFANLPLQRVYNDNGETKAFAHAFFHRPQYDQNPNFSLNDLYCLKKTSFLEYQHLLRILCFQEGRDSFSEDELPEEGTVMCIGCHPSNMLQSVRSCENINFDGQDYSRVRN